MQLEICNVKKQYKDKCAVNGVNLLLTPGVGGFWEQMVPGRRHL